MKPPLLTGSSRPRGSKPKSLRQRSRMQPQPARVNTHGHARALNLVCLPSYWAPCWCQILPVSLPVSLLISPAAWLSSRWQLQLHPAGLPGQGAIQVLQGGLAGEVELVLAAVHLCDGLLLFGTAEHDPAAASSAGTASGLCGLHRWTAAGVSWGSLGGQQAGEGRGIPGWSCAASWKPSVLVFLMLAGQFHTGHARFRGLSPPSLDLRCGLRPEGLCALSQMLGFWAAGRLVWPVPGV